MTNNLKNTGFTLVELLIVVALLGALAAIMLPSLRISKKKADDSLIKGEMREIQQAFVRFNNDCMPTTEQLKEMTNIYFAPLITGERADGSEYEEFDVERNRGWRGPYVLSEGIYTNPANGSNYPALLDPYGEAYVIECVITNGCTNLFMFSSTNYPSTNRPKRQLTFNG